MATRKPSSYLDRKHVVSGLRPGDRDQVLRDLVEHLVTAGALPGTSATAVLRAVLKRERVGSTGVGHGIAIPHAKTDRKSVV